MKTVLTIPIALVTMFTTLFPLTAAGQEPPSGTLSIGYVSAQRVLTESAAGKAEAARFQATQQQKMADLRAKQQVFEATRGQLAQASDSPTRTQLQQQAAQQQTDLERATAQAQADLQTLQRQLALELQARVKSVLDDIAKDQKLQLVLNGDATVLWAAPGLDLTPVVLTRLNADPAAPTPKP